MTLTALSLWLASAPAGAVDIESLIDAWTLEGAAGEAHDVAIAHRDQIIVGGFVDGGEGHAHDGQIISYHPDTSINWELTIDAGDETDASLRSSDDRVLAVALSPDDFSLAVCGQRGIDGGGDDDQVDRWFFLDRYAPVRVDDAAPPALVWNEVFRAAGAPDQACEDLHYADGVLTATGWSTNEGPEIAGQWITRAYGEDPTAPLFTRPSLTYNAEVDAPNLDAADRALAVARNEAGDLLAIAGRREVAGLTGSLTNDTDWHVRVYEVQFDAPQSRESYVLRWEHTLGGSREDAALALAFDPDPDRDRLVVVGFLNQGFDNAERSNRDGLVVAYDAQGTDEGAASIEWTAWFGTGGPDEVATSVVFDDEGNLLVAGSAADPSSNHEVFRVAQFDHDSGTVVAGKDYRGLDQGGDSRVLGIAAQAGRIVMAGYIGDGTERVFAASMIEADEDGDQVANSLDACPTDPNKADSAGACGCNVADADTDGDGTEDCLDDCPRDALKVEPLTCGCGEADTDTDGDTVVDCRDACPTDPDKAEEGSCGCGVPDLDLDDDGVLDCDDECPESLAGAEVDLAGCEAEPPDGSGCGCRSGGGSGVAGLGALVLLALIGRSRREAAPPHAVRHRGPSAAP